MSLVSTPTHVHKQVFLNAPNQFHSSHTIQQSTRGEESGTTVNESMVGGIFKAKHNKSGQARENIVKESSNRIVHSQQDT
jgi:hypothetical protein